jgi:hypothetical protein
VLRDVSLPVSLDEAVEQLVRRLAP